MTVLAHYHTGLAHYPAGEAWVVEGNRRHLCAIDNNTSISLSQLSLTVSRLPTRSALSDCHRQSAPLPEGALIGNNPYGIRCRAGACSCRGMIRKMQNPSVASQRQLPYPAGEPMGGGNRYRMCCNPFGISKFAVSLWQSDCHPEQSRRILKIPRQARNDRGGSE